MNRPLNVLPFSLLALASACSGEPADEADGNSVLIEGKAAGQPLLRTASKAGGTATCAVTVRVEIAEPFGAPDTSLAGDRDALRTEAGDLFKTIADRMCAAGEISPTAVQAYRRLLIQYGGGADNSAIYADVDGFGRDTLMFQYAFEAGSDGKFILPDQRDVHEALLCHFAPEAHEAMCQERLP